MIPEALEFQGQKGLEFLVATSSDIIEIGVDSRTEHCKIYEVFVLECRFLKVLPKTFNKVEIR